MDLIYQTIWRIGLLQVFGSMDALGVHSGDHREQLQLGSDNPKKIEHVYTTSSIIEGRRVTQTPNPRAEVRSQDHSLFPLIRIDSFDSSLESQFNQSTGPFGSSPM
jgi:hypothetical protein